MKNIWHCLIYAAFGFLVAAQADPYGKLLIQSGWRGLLIVTIGCFVMSLLCLVLAFFELKAELDADWEELDHEVDETEQELLVEHLARQHYKLQGKPIRFV